MAVTLTKNRIAAALCAIVAGIAIYALIDGGREPVHTIEQPVTVPGQAR